MADESRDTFPRVAGITETANREPGLQLLNALAGRMQQPMRDRYAEAQRLLEELFDEETDQAVRLRVGAALSMLRPGSRESRPSNPRVRG